MDADRVLPGVIELQAFSDAVKRFPDLQRIEPITGWQLWKRGHFLCLPWRRYYLLVAQPGSPAYEAAHGR